MVTFRRKGMEEVTLVGHNLSLEGICIFWSLSKSSTEICKSVFMLLPLAPTFLTCTLPLGYLYLHYIQESSYTRELSVLCCLNICDWGNKVLGK